MRPGLRSVLMLATVASPFGSAWAVCPASETVLSELTCSSTVTGHINYAARSDLGGATPSTYYTCGTPYAPLDQTNPEDVYSFACQHSGEVTLRVSGLDCDLDMYVLDDTCNPNGRSCVAGSTAASYVNDSVTFTCSAGQTYYVVIEGYGFTAPVPIAGYCSGASEGDYTLTFDVSAGTGCAEDCDDGVDNDLDGAIDCDDSDCAGDPVCHCDEDGDGYDGTACGGDDCDDTNIAIHPGADEYCNGYDDNCNGQTDESSAVDALLWYRDTDADNYGTPDTTAYGCSRPTGYVANDDDCYDLDASVSPIGSESANGVDDDCDGTVDETTSNYDDDGDGYSENGGDCNDGNASVAPADIEVCDGVDEDCDGVIDDNTSCHDDDGDGVTEGSGDCNDGDAAVSPDATEDMSNQIDDDCDGVIDAGLYDPDSDGYTAAGGDCDDGNGVVYPGAPEVQDGLDNDCDGVVDEGTDGYDDDRDGYTEEEGDCNDADRAVSPGASEYDNGIDDNCDDAVDEGGRNTDDDGDGISEAGGDCDDADASISPASTEVVNGIDDDCDASIDEGTDDADGDGYPAADGDCNDTDGWSNPGAAEVCDGVDNNCDGVTDEICGTRDTGEGKSDAAPGCGCSGGGAAAGLLPMLIGLAGVLRRRR